MAKREDIRKILIIGSGPIIIGQACEFDYSGTQACKALRAEGYDVVLVNSNPATIMTDPGMADHTYIEPLTVDRITAVIEKERPDALLPNLGGQTALNLASKLNEEGILKQYNVEVIGVDLEAIARGEDRIIFKETMDKIGVPVAKSEPIYSVEEAEKVAAELGYPVVLRPAYTMGGTGGGIVYNVEELRQVVPRGLAASLINQVLVEECVLGWEELELEVVRDAKGQKITVCFIENVDPMGVHTGDSFCVAPMLTVPQDVQDRLQDYSYRILDAIGVTGGTNVQFAHNREDNRIIVIEINPRTSRSSALASKATGFPIASVSTKLASGITMDELPYWRKGSLEKYEPYGDYVVVKFARWAFEKFPKAADKLGTQMKAVGEVMSIGQNFKEAFQKAVRSLEIGRAGLGRVKKLEALTTPELREKITYGNSERFFQIYELLRRGVTVEEIVKLTRITPYFIEQMKELADFDFSLDGQAWNSLPAEILRQAKKMGFSDKYLAQIFDVPEKAVRTRRQENGITATYRIVPVSGVEHAEYYYSTYSGAKDEVPVNDKKKIMILGGGPNRIGQGIEFDYCCVHASMALREMGYETIIVNSNPETVSTDYDSSDKLFFEPLTLEDVLHICEQEKPDGVIVQFGGQTPLNLANALEAHGVPVIGTSPKAIDLAEDREHFSALLRELGLKQADAGTATNVEDAAAIAARIGYPVLLRPSFVLGGRGMIIVYEEQELRRYMNEAVEASEERPVLIDRFLENAVEIDVDVIADRERAVIGAIMQHVEPAGIHSGDSASMIPAMGISMKMHKEITRASKELARRLNVCGLMNIQFAVKDEQLYVIEVNPRASRTVPFVSKAIGRPLAKLAAQVMAGKTLEELGFTREITPEYHCVKEAVFPWGRFPGIDVVLGPEMKSTGEVMGIDPDPDIAFAKSQISAFNPLPTEGKVFISVNDRDKERVLHMARQLADMGFTLCATRGTMIHLLQHDIECERAYKVNEARRPNIVDHIKNGDIDFIINTPGSHDARADDIIIRSSAIAAKTSYCTNLASAQACVNAIEALKNRNLQVCTIQEYHAQTV